MVISEQISYCVFLQILLNFQIIINNALYKVEDFDFQAVSGSFLFIHIAIYIYFLVIDI